MKLRLLWIFVFPLLFFGQEKKKAINIYHNQEIWLKTYTSEDKINQTLDSLVKQGYYTLKLDSIKKSEKEVKLYVTRGNFYKKVSLRLDSLAQIAIKLKDNATTSNLDSLTSIIHYYYLKKGYAFNKVISNLDFNQIPTQANIIVKLYQKKQLTLL